MLKEIQIKSKLKIKSFFHTLFSDFSVIKQNWKTIKITKKVNKFFWPTVKQKKKFTGQSKKVFFLITTTLITSENNFKKILFTLM